MDIKKIVKNCVSTHSKEWALKTTETDEDFCNTNGAITRTIEHALLMTNKEARKVLDKAVKDGLLIRNKATRGSWVRWLPVGYLADVKKSL